MEVLPPATIDGAGQSCWLVFAESGPRLEAVDSRHLKLDFLRFFPAVLHYSALRLRILGQDVRCISALYHRDLKRTLRSLFATTILEISCFRYSATLFLLSGNNSGVHRMATSSSDGVTPSAASPNRREYS